MQVFNKRNAISETVFAVAFMLTFSLSGYAQNPFDVNAPIRVMERTSDNSLLQNVPDTIEYDEKVQAPGFLAAWLNSIVKIVSDFVNPERVNTDGVSEHIARSIRESQRARTAVGKRNILINASYKARSIADIEAIMKHASSVADKEEIIRHAINVVNTPEDIVRLAEQIGSEYNAAYVYVDWANKKASTVAEVELLAKKIKPDMRGILAVAGAMKCETFSEFKKMYELASGDVESMAAVCRLGAGTARNLDQVMRFCAMTTTSDSKNWIVVADGLKYAKTVLDLKRLIAAIGDLEGLRWLHAEAATNPLFADYIITTLSGARERTAFTKMHRTYQEYYEAKKSYSNPVQTLKKKDAYETARIFYQSLR